VLSVTSPNEKGLHHVIDGQHRKAAVEMKFGPDELVPCIICDVSESSRAARMFDEINTSRKAPRAIDLFKIRVEAREAIEVEINEIVNQCGLEVTSNSGEGSISCVSTLQNVRLKFSGPILAETLKTILNVWGYDRKAVGGDIVAGFASFLNEYPNVYRRGLIEAMQELYTPAQLSRYAKSRKELDRGKIEDHIHRAIFDAYNQKAYSFGGKKLRRRGRDE